jgi:ferredoxin
LHVEGVEGQTRSFHLDMAACIGCLRCVEVCPEGALEVTTATGIYVPVLGGAEACWDLLAERSEGEEQSG